MLQKVGFHGQRLAGAIEFMPLNASHAVLRCWNCSTKWGGVQESKLRQMHDEEFECHEDLINAEVIFLGSKELH